MFYKWSLSAVIFAQVTLVVCNECTIAHRIGLKAEEYVLKAISNDTVTMEILILILKRQLLQILKNISRDTQASENYKNLIIYLSVKVW